MKALMIDIETFGLLPDSAVHQIGYCGADLTTGTYLIPPHNLYVRPNPDARMDFDTLCWWMQQSDEARSAVFPKEGVVRMSQAASFYALREVYELMGGKAAGVTVWASPAMFDLPLLTQSWGIPGPEGKPWPYYMERDLMTLYKMLDPEKKLKPTNPVEHDAASDAKAQMDHLIAIFRNNPILQGAK